MRLRAEKGKQEEFAFSRFARLLVFGRHIFVLIHPIVSVSRQELSLSLCASFVQRVDIRGTAETRPLRFLRLLSLCAYLSGGVLGI